MWLLDTGATDHLVDDMTPVENRREWKCPVKIPSS
jgi:hypothetical protein